jgi:hypothetical protein
MTAQTARVITDTVLFKPTEDILKTIEETAKTGNSYIWASLTNTQANEFIALGYEVKYSDVNKEWRVSW